MIIITIVIVIRLLNITTVYKLGSKKLLNPMENMRFHMRTRTTAFDVHKQHRWFLNLDLTFVHTRLVHELAKFGS